MFLDRFESVRIINLRHRGDRRAEMRAELHRIGAQEDARIAFFDACRFDDAGTFTSRGARGCFHSHLAVLEEAARAGRDVLILEDDADFTPAIAAATLPDDWDIFYGGYYAHDPADLHGGGITGAHCIAFRASVLPALVAYLHDLLRTPDHPPIDGAYVWFRRAHPALRTVFAAPVIAVQRSSRTDIARQRFFDRIPVLCQLAGCARRLRRRIARQTFGLPQALLLAAAMFLVATAIALLE